MEKKVDKALRNSEVNVSLDFMYFEYWAVEYGLNFLAGIRHAYKSNSVMSLITGVDVTVVSFKTIIGKEYSSETRPDIIEAFQIRLTRLKDLWDEDTHPELNSPEYFIKWARSKGETVYWLDSAIEQLEEKDPQVGNRFNANLQQSALEQDITSKRIDEIVRVIEKLGFPRYEIERKGKGKVKAVCLKRPDLFTESTFKKAWQAGLDAKEFRILDHEKFSN